MASSTVALGYPSSTNLFVETSVTGTKEAVKASSIVVYYLDLDNSANAAVSYFKMWNLGTGSVTVGTTDPDEIHYVPASTRIQVIIPPGKTFGTALTIACVTAGGTPGVTSPSSAFIARIVYV